MTQETVLIDGSVPARASDVLERLADLEIAQHTVSHPPLRTVADSKAHRHDPLGGYSKNLFLRNKKGRMWLVTLHEDRHVDLRALGEHIGAGRVSFASSRRLMNYLGVVPGAVTPLAVINDKGGAVAAVLDSRLLGFERVHFHPCENVFTTTLAPADLLRFMQASGHPPRIVDCDRFAVAAPDGAMPTSPRSRAHPSPGP